MTPILTCDIFYAFRLLSSGFAGTFDYVVIFCKIEFESDIHVYVYESILILQITSEKWIKIK